jgi:phosphate transport system protein
MLKQDNYQQHISAKFNEELESLRNQMLEMGGKVEQQLSEALDALMKMDSGAAELIVNRDREVNQMEMAIDDECASILARRQPTASDLRLVVAIIKVNTDLERIGDHACNIAEHVVYLVRGLDVRHGRLEELGDQITQRD